MENNYSIFLKECQKNMPYLFFKLGRQKSEYMLKIVYEYRKKYNITTVVDVLTIEDNFSIFLKITYKSREQLAYMELIDNWLYINIWDRIRDLIIFCILCVPNCPLHIEQGDDCTILNLSVHHTSEKIRKYLAKMKNNQHNMNSVNSQKNIVLIDNLEKLLFRK